jgi:phospholipid/cholesterol/gamma-HCH transport system substrate-binding protein
LIGSGAAHDWLEVHRIGIMENRARYTLIGAFTLACLLAGFAFVYWIENVGGFGERTVYDVRFEQPVSGLTEGANVLFNGVRAGSVARLDFDPSDPKRVTAVISLDPGTPVRADTQVDISYLGLTGAAAIALKGGSAQAPPLKSENGRRPVLVAGPDVGRTLTESAQGTLRRIDDILKENEKPLNTAIAGIATFADMLGRNSKRVEGLLGGLESLTGTGAPKKGPTVYDLAAATSFPNLEKTIKAQLVVSDPSALLLFDSQKILVRNGAGTYSNIADAQWADNLTKLLQARIVQSFENAHQLGAVSRPIDQLNAQYRLELAIRGFQIASQPSPNAVVDLSARLLNDKGAVTDARIFTANIPAKSMQAADAVAALNQAFLKVEGDLVAWTVGAI